MKFIQSRKSIKKGRRVSTVKHGQTPHHTTLKREDFRDKTICSTPSKFQFIPSKWSIQASWSSNPGINLIMSKTKTFPFQHK